MSETTTTTDVNRRNTTEALYLLGFSPKPHSNSSPQLDLDTSVLLNHLGVESIAAGPIVAWFKRIERLDFEGPQGEKNLADIQWLTPRVIAHERVVSSLSQQLTFYPSRFGTLFSSEEILVSFSSNATDTLMKYFERVCNRFEWGLKFYGDVVRAAEIMAERVGIVQDGKPVGGANYLKLRQLQRERSHATDGLLAETYQEAIQSLRSLFESIAFRSLPSSSKDPRQELLGNLAVLATDTESEQLANWSAHWNASKTSATGLRVELTGPWPAYSFCPSLSSTEGRSAA